MLLIFTLIAFLFHGFAPVSAFGVIVSCPEAVAAPAPVGERPACCANPDHRETKHSEPAKDPCEGCRACFCCNVAPANINIISPLAVVAVAQPISDVLANDSVRYLSVSTIPDVPPPKA